LNGFMDCTLEVYHGGVELRLTMSDTGLGFDISVTPRTVVGVNDRDLDKALLLSPNLSVAQMEWIRDEIGKRLIRRQIAATKNVCLAVEQLNTSSDELQALTTSLISETKNITNGVTSLNHYSDKLENLTKRIIKLTWTLIWLAILAVVVTIGIEVWHAKRELDAPVPPIVIQYRLPTAPQTPALPAR